MKVMDLFCSSHASTAVVTSSTKTKSHHHHDNNRRKLRQLLQQLPHLPCSSSSSSQLPINNPKPNNNNNNYLEKHKKHKSDENMRRHSSVQLSDLYTHTQSHQQHHRRSIDGSSTRYLLGDAAATPFIDWVSGDSDDNRITAMDPSISRRDAKAKHMVLERDVDHNNSPALRSSSSVRSPNQVVVLRVSLHCKACEGKVRKHISRMEGVTSFSIEMETKKVTIIGDVTPLGVLASVSKVKSAQLWPFPTSSTSPWST